MIFLNPPYLNVSGIAVFGDSDDPTQWYYSQTNPRLALTPQGKPQFLLAKLDRDMAAGSAVAAAGSVSLNFTVDLRVDAATLELTAQAIQKQFKLTALPRLSPVQYSDGTTRLVFLAAASAGGASPNASGFVEKADYETTPSLYGNNEALFMLALDADAAAAVQSAVSGGASPPLGIVYDLGFQAMQPAPGVKTTVEWGQVNTDLAARFGGAANAGRLSASNEISIAVDAFIEKGTIAISGVAPKAIDQVTAFITNQFFRPSLTPPNTGGPMFVFTGITQDQLASIASGFNAGSVIEARIAPQALMSALTSPYPSNEMMFTFNLAG